jgi:N-hydroxyarylamine O-acetyltransferase
VISAMLDVKAYLDRIAYRGSTAPNSETLRALHRAHLLAVPFENLDIALGRRIAMDLDAFVRKVVERRRGGFCYELNGAFAALLRALEFKVTLLSARVVGEGGRESPEFDHLCLRVELEESWLADVGFGELFLEPLRLHSKVGQTDPAGIFKIVQSDPGFLLEKAQPDGAWKSQYSFTLRPRRLEEFAGRCHYHQTSPDSHFVKNSICSLATDEGRITLSGMTLIVTKNGVRTETGITSERERAEVLRDPFGITSV